MTPVHLTRPRTLLLASVAGALCLASVLVVMDKTLSGLAEAHAAGLVLTLSFDVTALGGTQVVLPLAMAAVGALCVLRHWRGAIALAVAVAGTQVMVQLIKAVVSRPRPEANQSLADAGGSSFPSGHSATSVALYATLALIAVGALRGHARLAISVAGGALIAAVGASRVVVGAHYPSDVLAGWLLGAVVVGLSWLVAARTVPSAAR